MSATIAVNECDALACGFLCLRACPLGVLLAVPRNHNRDGSLKPRGTASPSPLATVTPALRGCPQRHLTRAEPERFPCSGV
jgi:hypothetical protein